MNKRLWNRASVWGKSLLEFVHRKMLCFTQKLLSRREKEGLKQYNILLSTIDETITERIIFYVAKTYNINIVLVIR